MYKKIIGICALSISLIFMTNTASAGVFSFGKAEPILGGFKIGESTTQQVFDFVKQNSGSCKAVQLPNISPQEPEQKKFAEQYYGGDIQSYKCDGLFPEMNSNPASQLPPSETIFSFVNNKLMILLVTLPEPGKFTIIKQSLTDKYGKAETEEVQDLIEVMADIQVQGLAAIGGLSNDPRTAQRTSSMAEQMRGKFRTNLEEKMKKDGFNELLCGIAEWTDHNVYVEARYDCPVFGQQYNMTGTLTYVDSDFMDKFNTFDQQWEAHQAKKRESATKNQVETMKNLL